MSNSNIKLTEEAKIQIAKLLGFDIPPDKKDDYHQILDDAIRKTAALNINNVKNLVPTGLENPVGDPLIESQIQKQKNEVTKNIQPNDLVTYHGRNVIDNLFDIVEDLPTRNNVNQVKTTLFDDNAITNPLLRGEIINQKNQILKNLSEAEGLQYLNSGSRQYNALFDDLQTDGAVTNILRSVINSSLNDFIEPTKTFLLTKNLEIPEFINRYGAGLFQNILVRELPNIDNGNVDFFIDYITQVQLGRASFLANLMVNNTPGVDSISNNQIELTNRGKDANKYIRYTTKDVGKDINLEKIRQVPDTSGSDEYPVNGYFIIGEQGNYNFSEQINKFSSQDRVQVDIQNDIQLPNQRTLDGYLINLGDPTTSAGESLTPFIGQTQFTKNDLSYGFNVNGRTELPATFNLITELASDELPLSVQNDSELGKGGYIFLKQTIQNRLDRATTKEIEGRVGNTTDAMNDPLGAGVALLKGQAPPFTLSYDITTLPGFLTAFDVVRRLSGIDPGISPIPEENIGSSVVNTIKNGINNLFGRNIFGGDINECDTNPDRLVPPKLPRNKTLLRFTSTGQLFKMYNTISYNKFTPEWLRDPDTLDLFSTLIPKPKSNLYIDSQRAYTTSQRIGGVLGLPVKEPDSNYVLDNTDPVRLNDSPNNSGLGSGKLSDDFVEYDSNADGTGEGGRISTIAIKPDEYDDIYWETNVVLRDNTDFGNPRITSDDPFRSDGQNWDGTINISSEFSFNGDSILCSTQTLANRDDIIGDVVRNSTRSLRGMSKGNAVKWPITSKEFCRVWTKDNGYNQISDLVRKGYTGYGRGLMTDTKYTTLDKNGMPIIAPTKQNSIIDENGERILDPTIAKRYMLSIENLAWRGAKVFLPCGEIGPNGGRIMWFPPYNISFSENNSVNWTTNEFVGRPEPIYTYNNSSKSGSLGFKLVVDHPSIVNHFNSDTFNEQNYGRGDFELEAFFDDCLNYPIEELLKKYKQFSSDEVNNLSALINKNKTTLDLIYSGNSKVYYDNDLPGDCTAGTIPNGCSENYSEDNLEKLFNEYIGRSAKYISENSDSSNSNWADLPKTQEFFNTTLPDGWADLNNLITTINDKIKEITDKGLDTKILSVIIPIETNTSFLNQDASGYNANLSSRRKNALIKYIKDKIKEVNTNFDVEKIKFNLDLKKSEGNNLDTGSVVETPSVDLNATNREQLNDENNSRSIFSKEAYLYRYAVINAAQIKIEYTDGTINNLGGQTSKNNDELQLKLNYYDSLFRRLKAGVLQPFNKECDMFEELKTNSPFLYDKLIEKLKFFHPAFHSTTPEGFNSRLTFLNQCAKAGDSINTSIVTNSAFGPPPVCILRIGDFYHTKIIINSINITYEPLVWDMNYEGIGVQPMIANVDIQFNYIGGSSLGGPINELQNALTFNYFANTNLYENRAKLSKDEEEYLNSILEEQNKQALNQIINKQDELNKFKLPTGLNTSPSNLRDLGAYSGTESNNKVQPRLTPTGGSGLGAVLENQVNNPTLNL
jgi:hypothetical protein